MYDEGKGDLAASSILSKVKAVKEMDEEKGFGPHQDDSPVEIKPGYVKTLGSDPSLVKDGKW